MSASPGESPEVGSTRRVRLLLAGAVVLGAAAWTWRDRGAPAPERGGPREAPLPTRLAPQELSESDANREAPPVAGAYRREVERPKPVEDLASTAASKEAAPEDQAPGGPANRRRDDKRTLPEIFRMPADPAGAAAPGEAPAAPREQEARGAPLAPGEAFAPFGRLVKCRLVETLDSVTARSEPIVGVVTQDLDWNGNVIIPAATEVYSYAKPEAVIDAAGAGRLVDSGEWTLVLPGRQGDENGRELILKARAVDRRETLTDARGAARSWGAGDGADGLVGATVSTLDNKEIKLFAAAAISGMAQGAAAVAERQQPAAGVAGVLGATQVAPTLGNALAGSAGSGAVEVMNEVAGRIREEISKRGVYVRVPAGKEFYLFVEQTIDPRASRVGLRLPDGARPGR